MKLFLAVLSTIIFSFQIAYGQLDSLDVMIGQMIMTGIGDYPGIDQNEQLKKEIKKGYIGGVILFEKNIAKSNSKTELIKLTTELQSIDESKLLIGIDQEGGRVNRLKQKYGFPKTVTAQYLGQIDNIDSTRFYAQQTSSILNQLGINVNFAPDVDVAVYPENPVITKLGRSFSDNEKVVVRHARQVIKGHREYGVVTTLKHFPGHGSSHADSHLGMADVTKYWEYRELTPYRRLIQEEQVDAIMSAHIVNKHLDPSGYPATLSPYIINEILRDTYGYQGVVFSDDMQMHAISSEYGFEESIVLAINAGIDILMFCNNVPGNERRSATEIHSVIKRAIEDNKVSTDRISQSYGRIQKLKKQIDSQE
ncbi:glycoside hydrolase family 3 protein [Reichenbachiella versicolor]|uniref:glycoside hydrolase family 3 protein n=1 Tax=Reichenbachiella versicolor TaxID=1821036 RepID=UPI000D6E0F28|nr:glycoside hydrolase family 3 N-terminal domain-containing protein [Reichenbachiella versicolor]